MEECHQWTRHIICFVPPPSVHLVLLMRSIMKISITDTRFVPKPETGCSSPTETFFQSDRSASINLLMTARKGKASSWHIPISKREGEHRHHYKRTVLIIKNSLSHSPSLEEVWQRAKIVPQSKRLLQSSAFLFFFFLCNVKLLFNPVHHCQCFRQHYSAASLPLPPVPLSLFHIKSL